ncbi:GNAT family N-acetyltransferase [uncultured Roseobacter sp.]|uniref:GNAT family N-acetyltransferase n=1 Tax=uncultured Roseobacter sp. TaxID=114847 RepID=UPI00261161C6|nr:GNAT family N-acetyltransferase [uncultured Roseobacter sp.]
MGPIDIRRATPVDADRLAACIQDAYASYTETIPDLPDVAADVEQDIANHFTWVAVLEGEIVGGAIVVLDIPDAQLANIAVAGSAKGRGVGRMLLRHIEQACQTLEVQVLKLSTHVNMPDNVAMYEHLGWRETGRAGSKVHMEKRLSEEP